MSVAPVITPGMTFDDAARAVLAYLRQHVPLGFWSVTRVENGRQSYLYLDDNVYDLAQGGSHPWEDSYCIWMVAGDAPAVAPDAQSVPAYRDAAVNAAAPIGAYAGAPILEPDGSLFGAICGLDPQRQGAKLAEIEPMLGLLSSLLNMVLAAERGQQQAHAATRRAMADAETDALTGLLNRRGWEAAAAAEQTRFTRLGDPTIVVMIDLDRLKDINDAAGHAAGDRYIIDAGRALGSALRPTDVLARLGGDEFGLILPGITEAAAEGRLGRLHAALDAAGVAGSVGWAPITIVSGFPSAVEAADEAMYAAKKVRRAHRRDVDALPTAS